MPHQQGIGLFDQCDILALVENRRNQNLGGVCYSTRS